MLDSIYHMPLKNTKNLHFWCENVKSFPYLQRYNVTITFPVNLYTTSGLSI